MRKIILLAAAVAAMASPAMAISRYNAMAYSCADAQATIRREGAVIFRRPAEHTRNMTLYDRYVRDRDSCNSNEYALQDYMPTKDNKSCPVYTCHSSSEIDDDTIFFNR